MKRPRFQSQLIQFCALALVALPVPGVWGQGKLSGFGPQPDQLSLRGFGRSEAGRPQVKRVDRSYAEIQIEKFDRDKDGALNRQEVASTGYNGALDTWFRQDANGDRKLTVNELSYVYAQIRHAKESKARQSALAKKRVAGIQVSSADKTNAKNQLRQLDANGDRKLNRTEVSAAYGGNASQMMRDYDTNRSGYLGYSELAMHFAKQRKVAEQQAQQQQVHLSRSLVMWNRSGYVVSGSKLVVPQPNAMAAGEFVRRYDTNQNGSLEAGELSRPGGDFTGADVDGNGSLSVNELTTWLQKKASGGNQRRTGSSWFQERDRNRDGAVTMAEYASKWTEALLTEFARYDRNQDGIITAAESYSATRSTGREFTSADVRVIETRVGALGTIRIDEDLEIGDINVRISLTHREPVNLTGTLISPSGKRLLLFTGAGKPWKGANLDTTIFDDESNGEMAKSPPPFRGSFKPEKAPETGGLSSYDGERARGLWRLEIDSSRSGYPGLLNRWSLEIQPR